MSGGLTESSLADSIGCTWNLIRAKTLQVSLDLVIADKTHGCFSQGEAMPQTMVPIVPFSSSLLQSC